MGLAKELDYDLLAQQLIRSIRSDKSQEWVNQRLGSTSNIVHRWEKGHAKASWEDFLKFCDVFRIDMKFIFVSYLRFQGEVHEVKELLSFLFSNKSLNDVSKSCGLATSKLRRLKNGETNLSLNNFLQIIFGFDDMESMALVYDLAANNSIPLLDESNNKRIEITKHYFSNPNIGLVLICLDLNAYKKLSFHQDSFISKASGIPLKEVNEILSLCEANDLIEMKNGLYQSGSIRVSDRGSRDQMLNTRKFWLEKAISNMSDKTELDAYGSMVFTASQSARKDIFGLYLRFFEDFKKIVMEDKDEDLIPLILNFNLINPGDDDIND